MKRKRIEDYGSNKLNTENMLLKLQKLTLNQTQNLKEVTNTFTEKQNKQLILRPPEKELENKIKELNSPYILYKEPSLPYKDPNKQLVLYAPTTNLLVSQGQKKVTNKETKKQEDIMDLGD